MSDEISTIIPEGTSSQTETPGLMQRTLTRRALFRTGAGAAAVAAGSVLLQPETAQATTRTERPTWNEVLDDSALLEKLHKEATEPFAERYKLFLEGAEGRGELQKESNQPQTIAEQMQRALRNSLTDPKTGIWAKWRKRLDPDAEDMESPRTRYQLYGMYQTVLLLNACIKDTQLDVGQPITEMGIDADDMWRSALFTAAIHSAITDTFLNQVERNDNGYNKPEGLTVSENGAIELTYEAKRKVMEIALNDAEITEFRRAWLALSLNLISVKDLPGFTEILLSLRSNRLCTRLLRDQPTESTKFRDMFDYDVTGEVSQLIDLASGRKRFNTDNPNLMFKQELESNAWTEAIRAKLAED